MKSITVTLCILYCYSWLLFSQSSQGLRHSRISLPQHEIILDTLSIVPGSVIMTSQENRLIPDSLYQVDYPGARVRFGSSLYESSGELFVTYRVFAFSFTREYYLRDTAEVFWSEIRQMPQTPDYLVRDPYTEANERLFSSGSISRGITMGNSQDVFFNSQLNLQLKGNLTENLSIEAVISDNNIPLQPEGYSQTIQEFDKVYISIYNEDLRLTAGDFLIEDNREYFFRLNRKAQGLLFSGQLSNAKDSSRMQTSLSASVAKGRFTRNTIMVAEGNQGPYRLTGENNETFIIVIAGTEKVFVDGKLMERGADRDYVIDYNLAEIVFTPNQPVNRNKRVVAEFEYSDRNYPRFLAYTSNRIEKKRSSLHIGFYNEYDAKNQSLQQSLNQEEKSLLSSIGDSLQLAFVPRIDSVEFSNSFVLYRRTDTLVHATVYPEVYVYSRDPALAHYRLNFTYVGENRGNYIVSSSSANGRVYQWVASAEDVPQGTHEPVVLLVTPKRHMLLGLSATQQLGMSQELCIDAAISNRDLNTFSSLDRDDNTGMALRMVLDHPVKDSDTSGIQLAGRLGYEMTGKNFSTIERYKPVEFERDWNITPGGLKGNQHHLFAEATLKTKEFGGIDYHIAHLSDDQFRGLKNIVRASNSFLGFTSSFQGSFLLTSGFALKTRFLRHQFDIFRPLGFLTAGFMTESEGNRWNEPGINSLNQNSFRNEDLAIYFKNAGSSENTWRIEFRQRKDYLPGAENFQLFSVSRDATGSLGLAKNKDQVFQGRLNYRTVEYPGFVDSLERENSFSGRMEYNGRFLKGVFVSGTFLETLSGREQKKDFFYLEVPAGQGQFKWVDYNGNGLKELDEFELAGFPDEGTHIRIFMPTNQWVKTQMNQAGQTLTIHPAAAWSGKEGFRKHLSRFHNSTSFRTSQKILDGEFRDLTRLFQVGMADNSLVSLNAGMRNILAFNRSHPGYGAEYTLTRNWTKTLLVNGDEKRSLNVQSIRLRWSPTDNLTFSPTTEWGERLNVSEYFPGRNYLISFSHYEGLLQYQPEMGVQIKLSSRISFKGNDDSFEKMKSLDIKGEFLLNLPEFLQLNADLKYTSINYTGAENTPLAYEMLEGLYPGRNLVWNLFVQKALPNNLEISLIYGGRLSAGRDVIHTGGLQGRAYF